MAAAPKLLVQTIRDVTIVDFRDSSILDTVQIEQIGQQLFKLVDEQAKKKLVLDFETVRFLSSSALGMTRSRCMPQIGQRPGSSRTISGCIGHV